MRKRFLETQRIKTRASDGKECYVVELTMFGAHDSEPVPDWVLVNRRFRTAEGSPVQLRGDGAFIVVSTGMSLERV
jgi:hypothetical protein